MEWIEISIDLKNIGMQINLIQKKNNWDKFFFEFGPKKRLIARLQRKIRKTNCFNYTYYLLPSDFFFAQDFSKSRKIYAFADLPK